MSLLIPVLLHPVSFVISFHAKGLPASEDVDEINESNDSNGTNESNVTQPVDPQLGPPIQAQDSQDSGGVVCAV